MKLKITLPNRRKQPVLWQYQSQHRPQPAYIEVDPSKWHYRKNRGVFVCRADYSGEIGNGVPADVWHNRVFRIPIAPEVSRGKLKALEHDEKFVSLVNELVQGWDEVWNNGNWVGKFNTGAHDLLCWHAWEKTSDAWGDM